MRESRLKIDIYMGIITISLFTLLLLIPLYLQTIDLKFYLIVGVLFIGSIISYYKELIPSICLSMIVDFIYASLVLSNIFFQKQNIAIQDLLWFLIIPLCYISFGSVGHHIALLQNNNEKLEIQNKRLVTVDEDTGLENSVAFMNDLKVYMNLCSRHKLSLSLMIIKLRYDKRLKSLIGQYWYTILLKEVAHTIESTLREEDRTYILREEQSFASLLITDDENSKHVKKRLLHNVANIKFDEETPLYGVNIDLRVAFKQYDYEVSTPWEYVEQANRELEYDV